MKCIEKISNGSQGTTTPACAGDNGDRTPSGGCTRRRAASALRGARPFALGFVLLLAFVLPPDSARAHTSEDILSLAVTNTTGYVINSDTNYPSSVYNRDTLMVSASIQYTTASAIQSSYDYRAAFRLMDSDTNVVPLVTPPGQTSDSFVVQDTVFLPLFGSMTAVRTYGAALRPAVRLDPYKKYHVELSLEERRSGSNQSFDFTGDELSTAPQTYLHFTNSVSGDVPANIIAVLDSAVMSRTYAVRTIPNKTSFSLAASYHLHRYDDFYGPVGNDNVGVRFDIELVDATTSQVVPLVASNVTVMRSVPRYTLGIPYKPAVFIASELINVEPALGVQLDSVNHTYFARVKISHAEIAGQPFVSGNQATTSATRLLHFNGQLLFGPVVTKFTSIDNTPPLGAVVPNAYVSTLLGVDNKSGYIVGHPNHVYGDGTDLDVHLLSNGDAVLASGSVSVQSPAPDADSVSRVRFERQGMTLDASGAHANVTVILPAGFGYRGNTAGRKLNSRVTWNGVALNGSLAPANDLSYNTPFFAAEETKPFWVGASSLRWQIVPGRFILLPTSIQYVRSDELNALESAPGLFEPNMYFKRSNEQYHRWLQSISSSQVIVSAAANGVAEMTLNVTMQPGSFKTHFPYDSTLRWTGSGQITFSNDQVVASNSFLQSAQAVTNRYDQDCPSCGVGLGRTNVVLYPAGSEMRFTVDGGLAVQGAYGAPAPLHWGWISEPSILKYAQRTTEFPSGSFLMSGCFLRGDQTMQPGQNRAGVMLLTGVAPGDGVSVERPGSLQYLDGYADYAGMNYRVESNGFIHAESVIAGKPTGFYDLTSRSKYYARWSGVSGIHEAAPDTFPSQLTLYGYDFTFDSYGVSYLSSQVKDSRTEGHIHVKHPSNFDQNFTELKFSCIGALESAKVPPNEGNLYKLLEYWNGDFITRAIQFDRDASVACNPSVGYLVLGIQGYANHIDTPLFGSLGFKTNGNLVTAKDVDMGEIKLAKGFNSRLKQPSVFEIKGPTNEVYHLNPATDAYYNDWETRDPAVTEGWINLAADTDVPFFKNMKVHVQTVPKTNSLAPIYLMGGWPTNGFGPANDNFFTNPGFDNDNTGYPVADGVEFYRDSPIADYHPRAQVDWLDVVHLDYPLTWMPSLRWFRSFEPVTSDILVLSTEHKVKYLSAKNAELLFGAKADTAPSFNLVSLGFNSVDQYKGVRQAFFDAGLGNQQFWITNGVAAMDEMLNADLHAFYEVPMVNTLGFTLNAFTQELELYRNQGQGVYQSQLPIIIAKYFDPATGALINKVRHMDVDGGGVVYNLSNHIDSFIAAIDAVQFIIQKDGGTNRATGSKLALAVVHHLIPKLDDLLKDKVNGKLDELFNKYFKEYDDSLDHVSELLSDVRNQVMQVRTNLQVGREFRQEIQQLYQSHDAELVTMMGKLQQDVTKYFNSFDPADNPFKDLPAGEPLAAVAQRFRDRFFATSLAPAVQVAFKQRLYDLDAAFREATDTGFGLLNAALRTMTDEVLAEGDKLFRKLLGKAGGEMAAAQINGYAHINGDSLKLLRLDLNAQFQASQTLEFKGYFQIKELDSDGTPSKCLPVSGRAAEVTCGAIDVPVSLGSNTTVTVNTKFTFDPGPQDSPFETPQLIGLGGNFTLKGSLKFQTFEITYLNAGASFGLLENYISSGARVKVQGFEGMGGVFLGRACTLDFMPWDPDVQSVLGQPPFTGGYYYAEIWVPISQVWWGIPKSCLFQVSAGLGTGMGYFAEGPTFVGKMFLGLTGEALCVVTFKANITMIGKHNPDGLTFKGKSSFEANLGPCPVCIPFKQDILMTYQNGDWDVEF